MRTLRTRAGQLASLTLLLLISGCTINVETGDSHGDHEHMEQVADSDTMFAAMMIPHHQQAIDMAELAIDRSTNPQLLSLAEGIIKNQEQEIVLMQSWLTDMEPSHMGHDMAGMASEEDLAKLATLNSPDFDELFLTLMIKHHEGALDMVDMIHQTKNAEVEQLGKNIESTQEAEIEFMKKLLDEIRG